MARPVRAINSTLRENGRRASPAGGTIEKAAASPVLEKPRKAANGDKAGRLRYRNAWQEAARGRRCRTHSRGKARRHA